MSDMDGERSDSYGVMITVGCYPCNGVGYERVTGHKGGGVRIYMKVV